MAGGTDNKQLKSAAKTRWRWQQQFVDDDEDDDEDDDGDDDGDDDDDEANTATAVGGDDNGCNSDGQGHRQQSTKIGSKDTVGVATAMETAAAGAATTAAARQ